MAKQKLNLFQFLVVFNVFVIKTQAFAYEAPPRCYNPNDRIGLCVSIYECQTLINILKTNEPTAFEFARKSECMAYGQGRTPFVCCTSDTGYTIRNDSITFPQDPVDAEDNRTQYITTTTMRGPRQNENKETFDLFPKPPRCGPLTIGNKIYGGEEAELGEHPWLANLEYITHNGAMESVCAGNVINQRYVLTAAHCVKGEIEVRVGKLVSVRVGDHNTQTAVDCDNSICLDTFQRLRVSKVVVHNAYGSTKEFHNHNDIALIRTDRNMQYSISVAPVCLPDVLPQRPELKSGAKLSVAGWGHTGDNRNSPVKLKVELPYVETQDCPEKVSPEQMCAGGEFRKDSCSGDSGGGLVRLLSGSWIIEGIVSFGRKCGLERPGIYTRVSKYVSWIRANVEP